MRSAIAVHLAVTFESPGSAPPDREEDPSGGSKGNNIPPIQRPDDGMVVIDVPPGTRPRIDLCITIATDPEGTGKVEISPSEPPATPPNPGDPPTSGPRRREEGKLVGPRRKRS